MNRYVLIAGVYNRLDRPELFVTRSVHMLAPSEEEARRATLSGFAKQDLFCTFLECENTKDMFDG